MAQSRRGKKGGNIKQVFRKHMRRNKGYLPIFYGNIGMDSSSVARSLRTFMQGGLRKSSKYGGYIPRKGTRRRQIYDEWKKVRKRMDELIAEGYDFDTDEFRQIYSDWTSLKNSKKQLERLKELKKKQLRREATSFMGITDKVKMWKRYKYRKLEWVDGEVVFPEVEPAETSLTIPEAEIPGQEVRTPDELGEPPLGLPAPADQIPYDIDIKIQNILDDELAYLDEISAYNLTNEKHIRRKEEAEKAAREVIHALDVATNEEKIAIVRFYEDNGNLERVIQEANDRYIGLFTYYYAVGFNIALAQLHIGLTDSNRFEEDEEGFIDMDSIRIPTDDDDDFLPF